MAKQSVGSNVTPKIVGFLCRGSASLFKRTLGVLLNSLLQEEKSVTDPLEDAKLSLREVKKS